MSTPVKQLAFPESRADRYARCVAISKRTEWQIDRDLIRRRVFDFSRKFLPDGMTFVDRLEFLSAAEARLFSQVQGRTYANLFGGVERFIAAKMLEQTREHVYGDQKALEGLVRFASEELKHQELFRRIELTLAGTMPPGYVVTAEPNSIAAAVLCKSTWAVLALTCHVEFIVQAHYARCIASSEGLCALFKDVFAFHWRDECQHVLLDELEWTSEDAKLSSDRRDRAVDEFIALMGSLAVSLQRQGDADADYFVKSLDRRLDEERIERIRATFLAAYRSQFIVSGAQHTQFRKLLERLTTVAQRARIEDFFDQIAVRAIAE